MTKQRLLLVLLIAAVLIAAFFIFDYAGQTKITSPFMTSRVTLGGEPTDVKTTFTANNAIYVVAQPTRFWINEAKVHLYKGEITSANRMETYDDITVNEAGYFTLHVGNASQFMPGTYSVAFYVADGHFIESKAKFIVE